MIVSVNQPCYLPWCGLIERIARADVHVHLDDVQYSKNSFFNRNRLIDRGGRDILLTVPVSVRLESTFTDVRIVENGWHVKHCRSLEQAYGRFPNAAPLLGGLAELLRPGYPNLAELNIAVTDWIVGVLSLRTRLVRASSFARAESATERLVGICTALEATEYYSPSGARDYLDPSAFSKRGVGVVFQQYAPAAYPQGNHPFVPFLSVLDVLLRFGGEETIRLVRAGAPG